MLKTVRFILAHDNNETETLEVPRAGIGVLPRPNELVEFARQPPWPYGEQRTLRVIRINHLFNLTDKTQTISVELVEAGPANHDPMPIAAPTT